MKKTFLMLVTLLSLAAVGGVAKADVRNSKPNTATAGFGRHLNNGRYVMGYYCPVGYRLVYGSYVTYQLVWNGFQYVYMPISTYGYFCTWP